MTSAPTTVLPAPGGPIRPRLAACRAPGCRARGWWAAPSRDHQMLEVSLGVAPYLVDRVAAKLLHRGFGQDQGHHGLGDHAGRRNRGRVAALVDRLGRSPAAVSMVSSARGTVEMGFIAARTRITSPVLIPPSTPLARLVRLAMPLGVALISSCAAEPRLVAVGKPSPTSTPLMACTTSARRPAGRPAVCPSG